MDIGMSQLFTSTVTDGTPPYSYQWYLDYGKVPGATDDSWTYAPSSSSVGTHWVYLNVTDAADAVALSSTVQVIVNGPLSVVLSPTSVTLDVGQLETFTSTVSGGTSPFTYQWYLNGVANGTSSNWIFTASSVGSDSVYVKVTDKLGVVATSTSATMIVNPALSVSISVTSANMDVGQSKTFAAVVSGGTPPYSYQWYLNGAKVSGATGASWTFNPTSPGVYTVYVIVTDSASVDPSVQSPSVQVWVNQTPTVNITPISTTMNVGFTITFTSSVSGGTPPYSYQWYINGAQVLGATRSALNFSEPAGSYTVYLNVTDSVSATSKSNIASVNVITVFSVTIAPSSASIAVGNSVPFTSTVTGGTAPYYYQWYLNGFAVAGAENPTWTFMPTSAGIYNIYLNVTVSSGTTAKSNIAQVTVTTGIPHGVGGVSASVSAFSFLAPWLSIISLLAAAMLLKGIIVKKKRT
jgi:hypothetical protein